jgi:hypothetical protein
VPTVSDFSLDRLDQLPDRLADQVRLVELDMVTAFGGEDLLD